MAVACIPGLHRDWRRSALGMQEEHMAMTVGDFLLKRLSEWGVRRIYGYPGDGSPAQCLIESHRSLLH